MRSGLDSIAYWLADFYLAATVLLTIVLLTLRLSKQPARRMAFQWGTLVGLALLVVFCALPGWPRIDLMHVVRAVPDAVFRSTSKTSLRKYSGDSTGIQTTAQASRVTTSHGVPQVAASSGSYSENEPSIADDDDAIVRDQETALSLAQAQASAPERFVRWVMQLDLGAGRLVLLGLFAVGCALTTLRVCVGVFAARRVCRSACRAPQTVVAELTRLAGKTRCPELLVSDAHPVPIATGTLRPKILLPPLFAERERREDCRGVLAHELAHIQNGDLWLLALDRCLLPLLWIHPLYWRLRQSFRDDQELLADAFAASQSSRTDYADMLVRWARRLAEEKRGRQLAGTVGVWDRPTRLADRISRLLHDHRLELGCSRSWRMTSLLSLTALPIFLSTASLSPDGRQAVNILDQWLSPAQPQMCGLGSCHHGMPLDLHKIDERNEYSAEQAVVVRVRQAGGSIKSERIGSSLFVTEINLVFGYTEDGRRVQNHSVSRIDPADFSKIHHLRALTLAGGQISDAIVERLAQLPELQDLHLWNATAITQAGLKSLAKIPRLHRLELTHAPINDLAFSELAAATNLEELTVAGSALNEESLHLVSRMTNLKKLSLEISDPSIGRQALMDLSGLVHLERLSLQCSRLSDEALSGLKSMTSLRLLALGETHVSTTAVAALRESLPGLDIQVGSQIFRALSAGPLSDDSENTHRREAALTTIRRFLNLSCGAPSKARRMMMDRPDDAKNKLAALKIYPAVKNVRWTLAYADSNAALAFSSEFSNHFGATLVLDCRLRWIDGAWKIEDIGATTAHGGVGAKVAEFAANYPKARATDEWIASPTSLQ